MAQLTLSSDALVSVGACLTAHLSASEIMALQPTTEAEYLLQPIARALCHHLVLNSASAYPARPYLLPAQDDTAAWAAVGARPLPFHPEPPRNTKIDEVLHASLRLSIQFYTHIVTVAIADSRADFFLGLPLQVVRSAHRGLRVHAPTVIAFQHQHIQPGVRRYVLCASDFQDLVGGGWRAAWRSTSSLQELVVIYKAFASRPRLAHGDADPASRPVQTCMTTGMSGPRPFAEGSSVGWAVLRAVIGRSGSEPHNPFRVTLVGFTRFGLEGELLSISRREKGARAGCVEFLRRREYIARVGQIQYLLETVL